MFRLQKNAAIHKLTHAFGFAVAGAAAPAVNTSAAALGFTAGAAALVFTAGATVEM